MIKVIKDLKDYSNQCIACGCMLNIYHIVMHSEWSLTSASFTLCKDCLKELHTAIPEEVTKEGDWVVSDKEPL